MGPFAAGWTEQDIEAALDRADPQELLYVPIVIGMNAADCSAGWAEEICLRLAGHPHFNVRGNAFLGLGHIARTCRALNAKAAVPVIKAALQDEDEFVRGHAASAAEDLCIYLGIHIPNEDSDAETASGP